MASRFFGKIAAALLAAGALAGLTDAHAEYPDKPIRVVVPWAAGGGTDVAARAILTPLAEELKQSIVVDNRAGANGAIGTALVAHAAPDGYTLAWVITDTHAINPHVYPKLAYDARADFAPIGMTGYFPYALVVNSAFPANNVAEFVQRAKDQRGKVTFASWGVGGSSHIAMEMFKGIGKFDALHVPYTSAPPAIAAVAAGQVDAMFLPMSVAVPQVTGGHVKLLGLAAPKRFAGAPDLKTFAEQGYAVDAGGWVGLMAPAGTPDAIVQKLNKALITVLQNPTVQDNLLKLNIDPATPNTPAQFRAFAISEYDRWGKTIRDANIHLE